MQNQWILTVPVLVMDLFFFFFNSLINLFMAVLGPRLRARALSSRGKRGPLFIAACGPLTIAASLVAEHRLQTRRLSNCGPRAQPLRGVWDLTGPGLEPVSPALAGGPPTTAPPGKPRWIYSYPKCWPIILLTRWLTVITEQQSMDTLRDQTWDYSVFHIQFWSPE